MCRYYVISPNVENNGNISSYLKEMFLNHTTIMGWGSDSPKGQMFANMKIGDYVICAQGANDNKRMFFAGMIDGEVNAEWPYYRKLRGFVDLRKEDSFFTMENAYGASPRIPAIYELKNNDADRAICNKIKKIVDNEIAMEEIRIIEQVLLNNHNLILTGAPGTGKTYLAKQIAQQMIFGEAKESLTDEEQNLFNEQCVFVQFHPSYDYTDFVEGLRPIKTEKEIGFKRKDGVFKEFCKRAIITKKMIKNQFDLLWKDIQDGTLEHIPLYSGQDSLRMIVDGNNHETIHFSKKDNPNDISSGNDVTLKDVYTIIIEKHINTIDALKDAGPNRDSLGVGGNQNDKWAVCKYILEKIHDKPYVFIIDEINRGEISKIFGELFYSIDLGYRGKKGKVDTQYQNLIPKEGDEDFNPDKEDVFRNGFYVPENVYIIGTMNDIDRSVESMDFAMRRRFAWKEITVESRQSMLDDEKAWGENGKPEQVVIVEIKNRMNNLNDCIIDKYGDEIISPKEKIGLTKSYQIGASYFLKYGLYGNFEDLWTNHLKGLLYEYLRGATNIEVKMERLHTAYNDINAH